MRGWIRTTNSTILKVLRTSKGVEPFAPTAVGLSTVSALTHNLVDDSGIEPLSRQGYYRLLSFTTVIAHIETHYGRVHSHTRNLASGHITSIGVLLYGVHYGIRTRILKLFHRYRTLQYCVSTIDLCGPLSCPFLDETHKTWRPIGVSIPLPRQ